MNALFKTLAHLRSLTRRPVLNSFSLQNYFARNFYNMRMLALFVAFAINFILLFYKVGACVLAAQDHSALNVNSDANG